MDYPVIISGGGIIGCYIHLRLKKAGINSLILEKSKEDTSRINSIRSLSLNPNTFRLLNNVDVNPETSLINTIKVSDSDGSGKIYFSAEEVDEIALSYVVMFDALLKELQIKAHQGIQYESEITELYPLESSIDIKLNNNQTLSSQLLIGSDGRNSPVARLSNFVSRDADYDQTAFTFLVSKTSDDTNSIASQIFSDKGIFARMPIKHPNKNMSSVVWSVPNNILEGFKENEFVNKYMNTITASIDTKLQIESEIISFPLSKHHLDSYMSEGVVVVGDAAHSLHPLAGQGINLGFADADILCEEIIEAYNKGFSIGSYRVLKKYELRRKSINEVMLRAMDGFVSLFGSSNIYIKVLRNLGLNLFNKMAFMKVFFINHASGSHKL
tara:strand:- start:4891 stop:6042 length:1152 start_codon:yes stop_codon:yes gene_type:complete